MTASVTLFVTCAGCATAPQRPTIAESDPGEPLREASVLVDADADAATVDVTFGDGANLVLASVGDAVVLRLPKATGPLTLDGAADTVFTPAVDGEVWLVAATKPGVFGIRRAGAGDRASLAGVLVVVDSRVGTLKHRILLLDDRADGIERIDGLGNVLLVNGQARAVATVVTGTAERWHLVNVAKVRSFVLLLPGHVLTRLDGDAVLELSLLPGQCASVDIRFDQPATAAVDLVTLDGEVSGSAEAYPILHVRYSTNPKEQS